MREVEGLSQNRRGTESENHRVTESRVTASQSCSVEAPRTRSPAAPVVLRQTLHPQHPPPRRRAGPARGSGRAGAAPEGAGGGRARPGTTCPSSAAPLPPAACAVPRRAAPGPGPQREPGGGGGGAGALAGEERARTPPSRPASLPRSLRRRASLPAPRQAAAGRGPGSGGDGRKARAGRAGA